jgi:hypothetical protein
MNRPKKPSTVAQASTEIRSEAAIKLFPATSKKTEDYGPIDKDGEEGDDTDISTVLIEVAQNGYMITFTLQDGTEEKSVHTDFDDVLKAIRSRH